MKILCFIDNLGAGGAQRQLVGLAKMLTEHHYDVLVAYYQNDFFFKSYLDESKVQNALISSSSSKVLLLYNIYKFFKSYKPDLVISYLESPSIIACVLRLFGLKYKLVVSERNTNVHYQKRDNLRFQLFRIADYVVPNSYAQENFIKKHFAFLTPKVKTITNFCSFLDYKIEQKKRRNVPEIVVVASIWPPKNTLGFIKSVGILKERGMKFHISWYGKTGETSYYHQCIEILNSLGLSEVIDLLDKTKDIANIYREADYFCLPSFYEGTPNVICEAICMSLPVICSDVCDNGIYVHQGENGYLFDPNDEIDIANQLEKALSINHQKYCEFSAKSRIIAEQYLSESLFLEQYNRLING